MEKLCFASPRLTKRAGTRSFTRSPVRLTGVFGCLIGLSCLATPQAIQAQESAVQKELNRRINNANKAYELLKSGDVAYRKADYATAVNDYSLAFNLFPPGSLNQQLRAAAAERYATAATERARGLAKHGNYNQAKELLKTVLKPEIAPAHAGALKLLGQIDDPIRYNHALTPAHVKNVHKVGMLLREAQGFHSLGQYDRAQQVYLAVLRIDPYNKAARRGMEQINVTKSDYYRAASDQTRADMLSEVARQWELPVNPENAPGAAAKLPGQEAAFAPDLREKLASIIVDTVVLEGTSLQEAADYIRVQSRQNDIPNPAGETTGVNVIINLGDPDNARVKAILAARVNLKARSLPLTTILNYVTDQTRTQWRTDGASVIITPRGTIDGTAMVSRTFRVPPNFLTATVDNGANNDNPFDDDGGAGPGVGKLPKTMGIEEFLKQSGVTFPEGATASYIKSTGTLTIRNTPENIDLVDQLISIIADEEPVMVVVKTTIIRISDEKLKELGFDWRVTPVEIIRKGLFLGGGTTGNGVPLGAFPQPPFDTINGNPVTAGNRSGNSAIAPDNIDAYLQAESTGTIANVAQRAPGILTLSGVYSGIQVQMMMRGLNNKTGVDVMVQPSTIARSGERSTIEIIREFIYPTEYEPPEIPNTVGGGGFFDPATGAIGAAPAPTPVTPATPTAFETRNVGVRLEVEPTVGPERNYIELSVQPEMVDFQGFVNYGSPINGSSGGGLGFDPDAAGNPFTATGGTFGRVTDNRILMPVFRTLRLQNTTVNIQDGATLVLGGLRTSRKTKIEDKTPLLGDIPYVGRLFRSDSSRTRREAVLVMVSAELVDPTGKPWRNR